MKSMSSGLSYIFFNRYCSKNVGFTRVLAGAAIHGLARQTLRLNLRKRSGNEGVSAAIATPGVDKEHYILAAL